MSDTTIDTLLGCAFGFLAFLLVACVVCIVWGIATSPTCAQRWEKSNHPAKIVNNTCMVEVDGAFIPESSIHYDMGAEQ